MTAYERVHEQLSHLLGCDTQGLRDLLNKPCPAGVFIDAVYKASSLTKAQFAQHVKHVLAPLGARMPGRYFKGDLNDLVNVLLTREGKGQVMCLLPTQDPLGVVWRDAQTMVLFELASA